MCLFEPAPEFWPNIRKVFAANDISDPLACFAGLLSDETVPDPSGLNYDPTMKDGWPAAAWVDVEEISRPYRYLHEPHHTAVTRQTKLDDWVEAIPDAITMDIEGAEMRVLRGAYTTLAIHRPLVWVSIHPDLMLRDYDATPEQVFALFDDLEYDARHLATDHESHWFFWPKERNVH